MATHDDPLFRPEPRLPDESELSTDGVDLTLIRWMLALTPAERLDALEKQQELLASARQ